MFFDKYILFCLKLQQTTQTYYLLCKTFFELKVYFESPRQLSICSCDTLTELMTKTQPNIEC